MAGNIRRNRNNELLSELEAVQRTLVLQTTGRSPDASGFPGPQGDPGEDLQAWPPGARIELDTGSTAPLDVDYLVGQASGSLTAEIVVGTTPGGELGGTWASPTVDATHSGSAHIGTLLKSNSGTDTSAGATNVDTYAISGLTAKDRLLILYDISSLTAATEAPRFYSVTDSLVLAYATAGGGQLALGTSVAGSTVISQSQQSTTVVNSVTTEGGACTTGGGSTATGSVGGASQTVTTAWTGSWTISFRHGGVSGGGTFRWSWSIYKLLGQ